MQKKECICKSMWRLRWHLCH